MCLQLRSINDEWLYSEIKKNFFNSLFSLKLFNNAFVFKDAYPNNVIFLTQY